MRQAALYVLAAVFLVLIVSVAWWNREFAVPPQGPARYIVAPGDTLSDVTTRLDVAPSALAAANDTTVDVLEQTLRPGRQLTVPPERPSLAAVWRVHAVGLLAEILGVLMSFWLAMVAGLLPSELRRQILGIALVLGLASYAASQATTTGTPALTPQLVFGAIKDGFAWSAAFPMFARAFGFREA